MPAEPLQLIPGAPQRVGRADLDALRASPLFGSADRWLRKRACLGPEALDWLLQRTSSVAVADFAEANAPEGSVGLAIFRGHYDAEDAGRALRAAAAVLGQPGLQTVERERGGYRVLSAGPLSAVQLDRRMLALGHNAPMQTMLDVASRRAPPWIAAKGGLVHSLDAERWLTSHTAATVGTVPARALRRLQRGLAAIGGRKLGVGVQHAAAAISVAPRSTSVDARVLYPDAATASQAAGQALPVLNRANFILRLIGAPLPLERTQIVTAEARMDLSLSLREEELRGLLERFEWMLDSGSDACGVSATRQGPRWPG